MSESSILAGLFALIGVPLFITGAAMLARRIASITRGTLINAEVVRLETHRLPAAVKRAPQGRGSHSASTATPYVRYTTAHGQQITAKFDHQVTRKTWAKYPVGAHMPVRIDPARPSFAYDPAIASMYVFPGLLAFAGLLMTLIALGIVFGAPPAAAP